MRVVIDTNVLVSAALKDRDPEVVIKWVVAHPNWLWVVTPEIVAEYKAVLARPKFGLTRDLLDHWFVLLDSATALLVLDPPAFEYPRDPKDAIFIACAIAVQADYLNHGRPGLWAGSQIAFDNHLVRRPVQAACLRRDRVTETSPDRQRVAGYGRM